jgi:hypothetical protein
MSAQREYSGGQRKKAALGWRGLVYERCLSAIGETNPIDYLVRLKQERSSSHRAAFRFPTRCPAHPELSL